MSGQDDFIDMICNVAGGMIGAIGAAADKEDLVSARGTALVQTGVLMLVGGLNRTLQAVCDDVDVSDMNIGDLIEEGTALINARAQTLGIEVVVHHVGH